MRLTERFAAVLDKGLLAAADLAKGSWQQALIYVGVLLLLVFAFALAYVVLDWLDGMALLAPGG